MSGATTERRDGEHTLDDSEEAHEIDHDDERGDPPAVEPNDEEEFGKERSLEIPGSNRSVKKKFYEKTFEDKQALKEYKKKQDKKNTPKKGDAVIIMNNGEIGQITEIASGMMGRNKILLPGGKETKFWRSNYIIVPEGEKTDDDESNQSRSLSMSSHESGGNDGRPFGNFHNLGERGHALESYQANLPRENGGNHPTSTNEQDSRKRMMGIFPESEAGGREQVNLTRPRFVPDAQGKPKRELPQQSSSSGKSGKSNPGVRRSISSDI
jgi:hypothetical protein